MSLPPVRGDREFAKFCETTDGSVAVRTCSEITNQIEGEFSVSGLKNGGRITTTIVSTTAVALPTTPLTARNAIAIRNLSNEDTLYIGFDNLVEANDNVGSTAGWQVGPQENLQFDVTETVILYGIASVASLKVQIMELS